MSLVDQFYNDIVNARLPPWFYFVTTAVLLVPLKKSNANDGAVRPLGIGNAARRAMARCVTASVRVEMSEKLAPEQLGVAMPYGHCLAAGMREERQLEPGKVWLHLDEENAFNNMHRSSIVESLANSSSFAAFGRFMHAHLLPMSNIYLSNERRTLCPFASETGLQQGDPANPGAFSLTAQADLLALHQKAQQGGGSARAFIDDTFLKCRAGDVITLVTNHSARIAREGRSLNASKSVCFCFSIDALAQDPLLAPHVTRTMEDGLQVTRLGGIRLVDDGIKVAGVYIGRPEFVQAALAREAFNQCSFLRTLTN